MKTNHPPIPEAILHPHVRIHVETASRFQNIMPLIPPEQLVSLNLGNWHWEPSSRDQDSPLEAQPLLKSYLLKAKNLTTLTHTVESIDRYRPESGSDIHPFPSFVSSQKMPAFKHLNIAAYQWNHSASEVQSSWDFTNLVSLDIRGVPLSAFLRSIDFSQFGKLQALKVGDFGWSKKEEGREDGTLMLNEFLAWVPDLEELHVDGRSAEFRFDVLSKMKNLRCLTLRERIAFTKDEEKNWV
jgi:hypothetical protein